MGNLYSQKEKSSVETVTKLSLDDFVLKHYPDKNTAPELFQVEQNWFIMNRPLYKEYVTELAYCMKEEEIVKPVVDEIINDPISTPWYKNDKILFFGVPVVFITGTITGLILAKKI
jgi:hypothetical protein